MTYKKVVLGILIAVAAVCAILGFLVIFGAVGEMEQNCELSVGWLFHRVFYGALLFIPGLICLSIDIDLD